MKKLFLPITAGFLTAILLTTTLAGAANLNQAVAQLPDNEEWSIMAHAAIGQTAGSSYLSRPLNSSAATDYEKRILAITSQGFNPQTISSENFVAKLENMFDGNQIGDSSLVNDDIFGILALKSAGGSQNIINKSRQFLLSQQNSDGGWGYGTNVASDSNTTGAAVAALASTGSVPSSAISYLRSTQSTNSGFGYTVGQVPDGASTSWVIWGLRAARESIPTSATTFLENLQLSNGTFKWRSTDNQGSTLITAYAVIALSGKTLPIRTVSNSSPTPTPTPTPIPVPTPTPVPTPPSPTPIPVDTFDSACVGYSVPASIQTNQNFTATVTVRNTGNTTWHSSQNFVLGSQNPQDNQFWGTARIALPQAQIVPGQTATFNLNLRAPGHAGNHSFTWRTLQENVRWFGETCSTSITVLPSVLPPPPLPPVPTPIPTPIPVPIPVPPPTPIPVPVPTPPSPLPPVPSSLSVTISYPNNKIFSGNIPYTHNISAMDALISAANQINLLYQIQTTVLGRFVRSINGYGPLGTSGWQYSVNGTVPAEGADSYILRSGDVVKWFYGSPNIQPY